MFNEGLRLLVNFFHFCSKSLTEYDPRLVAPACLYLSAKAEESTVQARLLVFYIKKMCNTCYLSYFFDFCLILFVNVVFLSWEPLLFILADPDDLRYRFEIKDILEMEMKVLEALNYYLVVFHPYRSLTQWVYMLIAADFLTFFPFGICGNWYDFSFFSFCERINYMV